MRERVRRRSSTECRSNLNRYVSMLTPILCLFSATIKACIFFLPSHPCLLSVVHKVSVFSLGVRVCLVVTWDDPGWMMASLSAVAATGSPSVQYGDISASASQACSLSGDTGLIEDILWDMTGRRLRLKVHQLNLTKLPHISRAEDRKIAQNYRSFPVAYSAGKLR